MRDTKAIEILDCTLRDGGYINGWSFADTTSREIIASLVEAGIELVECGYLSDSRGGSVDTTLFPSIARAETIINSLELPDSCASRFVLMINHSEVDVSKLPLRNGNDYISGLRLAFHQKDLESALAEAVTLKEKGYDVFVQPMVTGKYSDIELLQLVEKVNQIEPHALYLVDSFGSMTSDQLQKLFYLVDDNLNEGIKLGFHSHNNKQLSYANAILFANSAGSRQLLVDSTIFGMGRGAGNLLTEVFADYLNHAFDKNYQITALLQVIDNFLEATYREEYWGYSVAHFLSAAAECHPNYASYLTNKKTLPVSSIHSILKSIEPEYKNSFNKPYIEKLYLKYQSSMGELEVKEPILFNASCTPLIIGSGASVKKQRKKLDSLIASESLMTIAVNHSPDLEKEVDYVFFSNQKRYSENGHSIEDPNRLILTSNITPLDKHRDSFRLAYHSLYNALPQPSHNAALLLLALLQQQGFKKVQLAGIDGYLTESHKNYSYQELGRLVDKKEIDSQNNEIAEALKVLSEQIRIRFVTDSLYSHYVPKRILGVIPARYQSSRFPGKPLAQIDGVPMIQRTYDQVKHCERLDQLLVATDDARIEAYCKENSIPVLMTSSDCATGTDRLAEVAAQEDYDLYINIQGDEPVIDSRVIDQVVDEYLEFGETYIAYNCYKAISSQEDVIRDSIIKVIVNSDNELLYMSRLGVPFNKSKDVRTYLKQVCVYGFTLQSLKIFSETEKTLNEKFEDIEILRLVDLGYQVKMIPTEYDSLAVDLPEDVARVEAFLSNR